MAPEQRRQAIDYLVTNCDCWKAPGDREVLNGLPDPKLQQLREAAERQAKAVAVANSAVRGFSDGRGNAYRLNPESGQWEHRTVAGAAPEPPAPRPSEDPPPLPPVENMPYGKKKPMMADDEEEDEEVAEEMEKRKKKMMAKNSRPRTLEDWLRQAPLEVQNTFRYAQQIEAREKEKLIGQLLVNVAESERSAHRERLQRRSLEDLQNDLALVPKAPVESTAPTGNRSRRVARTEAADPDLLMLPTMNWQELGKGGGQTAVPLPEPVGVDNTSDELTEDEILEQLPPALRSRVLNATVIENQEKQKLIAELTENLDEEVERKLNARLQRKSLDELRDLQALAPRREAGRTNYFGSAAAPTGNYAVDPSDILPLPTMNWAEIAGNGSSRR